MGETGRIPPPLDRSAGEELLGAEFGRLADRHDRQWLAENGEAWRWRRSEHVDRKTRLARLAGIAAPTADELFERAEEARLARESLFGHDRK